jgi:ureidoglycolate lyase
MLLARPLTASAFSPYGDVVSARSEGGSAANQGTALRFDRAAALESLRPSARPNLAVFQSHPQALPFTVRLVERHPFSTQVFLPLVCERFLVCVTSTRPDGGPDVLGLRAFICGPGQGINYRAGVWHHPIVAIDGPAEFAMLAWEDGTEGDCEERLLDEPCAIVVAP